MLGSQVAIKFAYSLVLVLVIVFGKVSCENYESLEEDFSKKNSKVLDVIKDEVQLMHKELTEKFIIETSRKKRSTNRFTYAIKLDQSRNYLEARVTGEEAYSFVCNGNVFVLQSDGIYRLNGFKNSASESSYTEANSTTPTLRKLNQWSLNPGDRVLHAHEWQNKCFVLITSKNGTFSSVYTLHGNQMTPIFRQQIRNYGLAVTAKFFTFKWNLYLIIINDNSVHSLTICPLLRWAGTYMDEIHAIQTRGASAVETFVINSKKYIAIAQSQDSSGNYEVGTQILALDEREELEKMQLLWSYHPVALQYIQFLNHHYLVIGLAKESSIIYWFGGIDFIYWQYLDGYMGSTLFLDGFTLPDEEAVLLAARTTSVQFYTRSSSSTILTLNSDTNNLTVNPPDRIVQAKFLKPSLAEVYLTVVKNSSGVISISIYPVLLIRKEIAESQIKESESKLSQCLVEVRRKLTDEGGIVQKMAEENIKIITVDRDLKYTGKIVNPSEVIFDPSQTIISSVQIQPEQYYEDTFDTSPANLLRATKVEIEKLNSKVLIHLPYVLTKSKPGIISGNYRFNEGFQANKFLGYKTNIVFEILNGVDWIDFNQFSLRDSDNYPQQITGYWSISNLVAKSVKLESTISGIEIDEFMLTRCPAKPSDYVQDVNGNLIFKNDVYFNQILIISPYARINGIYLSDIVLRNSPVNEIRGYKHTQNLRGSENFKFKYINGEDYLEWFDSVLHTEGEEQYSNGLKTLESNGINHFKSLKVTYVNNRNWTSFCSTAVINGVDQSIEGDFRVENLIVDSLVTESVGGVYFDTLMNTYNFQDIKSKIYISTLTALEDIFTEQINGIEISYVAARNNENVTIYGPVELHECIVDGSIIVPENVTIGGQDVSELSKNRLKYIYYLAKSPDQIHFKGSVEANNLHTEYINEKGWKRLENEYWSKSMTNVVPGPLDSRGRRVSVKSDFNTKTLNSINLNDDLVRTDEGGSIDVGINFGGKVYSLGEIYHHEGKTLSGLDISESVIGIVQNNEGEVITGKKYFKGNVVAYGIQTLSLNGIHPTMDVVFLDSLETQNIIGTKVFNNLVFMKDLDADGNIDVQGMVNKYYLDKIVATSAMKDSPVIYIEGNVQFNQTFYASDFYVEKLNERNINEFLENVIYLDKPQEINFPLVIYNRSMNVNGSANVSYINQVNVKNYLSKVIYMNETPKDRINGTKTFVNFQAENVECTYFNRISLRELQENSLHKSGSQNVSGKMYFDSIKVEGIELDEIAGIPFEDFISTQENDVCEIDFDVILTQSDIYADSGFNTKTLNSYPIEEISAGYQKGLGDRIFNEVEVEGNLFWDEDEQENPESLSRLFEKAVKLDSVQTISGKVEFAGGFDAENLTSYPWINNINLYEISKDGVYENSNDELIFKGKNKFLYPVVILDPQVDVEYLDVEKVNGVNLKELDKKAIRDSYPGIIYGTKTFSVGLEVGELTFEDLQDQGNFTDFVKNNDTRTVEEVEFDDIYIEDELNYNNSEYFDLKDILDHRVSIKQDQVLYGNYTIPVLNVTNNCEPEIINGIKLADIYLNKPGQSVHTIYGDKTFTNGISVNGEVKTADVNGYNFAALHSDVYRRTEPEKLTRPVIFISPVKINKPIEVKNKINDYEYDKLSERFSEALQGVEARAMHYKAIEPKQFEKLQQHHEISKEKSFWLEYLRQTNEHNVQDLGSAKRVEQTLTEKGLIIALHGETDGISAKLPKGCYCNSIKFLRFKASVTTVESITVKCVSQFVISSNPSGTVYTVKDDGVSYNNTCSTSIGSPELVIFSGADLNSISIGKELWRKPSNGHLEDAKSFSDKGVDIIILAYSYQSLMSGDRNVGLEVFSVDNGVVISIQTLSNVNAKRIAVNYVKNQWILAAAGPSGSMESCNSTSSIYLWSSTKKKFILLRDINTKGAVDVTFLNIEDQSDNYAGHSLNFVAFAHETNLEGGEVAVYSYNEDEQNYFLSESLRFKWSVSALDYICIQENCFLIVVIPQEGVYLYEYKYVEGFQLSLIVPVRDIMDATPFDLDHYLYFALASSITSQIVEGYIAGQYHQTDRTNEILGN